MSGYIIVDGVPTAIAQVKTDYYLRKRFIAGDFAITYEWADNFLTDDPGPIQSPRDPEPGPGKPWTVEQSILPISIENGALVIDATGSSGTQQALVTSAAESFTRSAGQIVEARIWQDALVTNDRFLTTRKSGAIGNPTDGFESRATALRLYQDGNFVVLDFDWSERGTRWYDFAMIHRSSGIFYLAKISNSWQLLYAYNNHGTTSSYFLLLATFSDHIRRWDYVRVPEERWTPTPLASDSFDRTAGSLLGSDTDGAGHPEANGGDSLTWQTVAGSAGFNLTGTKITPASDVNTQNMVDCGQSSVVIEGTVNSSNATLGAAAITYRVTDLDNQMRAELNGATELRVRERKAGNNSTLASAAITVSNNTDHRLVVLVDGDKHTAVFDDDVVTTPVTNTFQQSINTVGMYCNRTVYTFDDFVVWPRYPDMTGAPL